MSPRFSRFAAAFACGVAAIAASPVLPLSLSTAANAQPAPAQSPLIDQFKATLQAYGTFRPHPRHGEVWQPADVPQGWKPYAPCNWVADARLGWFFDDKTEGAASSITTAAGRTRRAPAGCGCPARSSAPAGWCGAPATNGWAGPRCRRMPTSRPSRPTPSTPTSTGPSWRRPSSPMAARAAPASSRPRRPCWRRPRSSPRSGLSTASSCSCCRRRSPFISSM